MEESPSFLKLNNIYPGLCVSHIFFIHSLINRHLGCFRILATVTKCHNESGSGVQLSLQGGDFVSYEYILRSGITDSSGSTIFNLIRNLYTVFYNGCTNLHSHRNSILGFPFLPSLTNHLLSHLLGNSHWKGYVFFEMISQRSLNLHFPMIYNIEHLFMCLLPIVMFCLENVCSNSLIILKTINDRRLHKEILWGKGFTRVLSLPHKGSCLPSSQV